MKEGCFILATFEKLSLVVQEKILDAAASVFAEEGYHHASIANICSKAHISNGALYKYFKNKEALFFSVLDRSVKLVEIEVYKKYFVDVKSLFDAVYSLLKALVRHCENHHDYMAIYCDLGSSSMNRFAAITSEKYRQATSTYTIRMVEAGKKSGEIDRRVSNQVAAYMIDSYITMFAYALVSEYQGKRFNSFFSVNGKMLGSEEQIDLIVLSLRQALTKN